MRPHDNTDGPRSAKNTKQHAAFLQQVRGDDRRRYLEWFTTIPLWLDLGDVRVVHACWHDDLITLVENRCGSSAPFDELQHLVAASTNGDDLYDAVETLLKGSEFSLVDRGQPEYHDKGGHPRVAPGCVVERQSPHTARHRRDGRQVHHRHRRRVPAAARVRALRRRPVIRLHRASFGVLRPLLAARFAQAPT